MCSLNKEKIYLTNIFIIDWDDTLFPTTWINNNSIDINNEKTKNEYRLYFLELDKIISNLIITFNKIGDIYIVTNANLKWIKTCLNLLEKTTYEIIRNNIRIVSARDTYSLIKSSPLEWKIFTFQDIVEEILYSIYDKLKPLTYMNIISIGDAPYEYNALLNLDNYFKSNTIFKNKINKDFNYLLKHIKFMDNPDFNNIIEQVQSLLNNKEKIVNSLTYLDLKFE